MTLPDHDYAKLDREYRFNFYEDRLKQAKKLGYNYVSECLVKLYRKHKSQPKVARILNLGHDSILYPLKKFGEPRNPPGGFRPGDKRYGKPSQGRRFVVKD